MGTIRDTTRFSSLGFRFAWILVPICTSAWFSFPICKKNVSYDNDNFYEKKKIPSLHIIVKGCELWEVIWSLCSNTWKLSIRADSAYVGPWIRTGPIKLILNHDSRKRCTRVGEFLGDFLVALSLQCRLQGAELSPRRS